MRKLKNSELGRKNIEEFKKADKTPFVVILDNIRSLNNIGSVFRTSDALLIDSIYLCGFTAVPPHKDIHKTALGSTESVNWKYFEKTSMAINYLKELGYKIIAIEQTENSVLLNDYFCNKDHKYAYVFGNEVKGVDQAIVDICDDIIEIPQFGTKHSLNISVSVGIVLWDQFSKLLKN